MMEKTKNTLQHYVEDFGNFERNLNGEQPQKVHEIRHEAIRFFQEKGFPGAKDEDWRQTNLTPFLEQKFHYAPILTVEDKLERKIDSYFLKDFTGSQLVFINGHFQEGLSRFSESDGMDVLPLNRWLNDRPQEAADLLYDPGVFKYNAFSALNTAFLRDGAYINVKRGSEQTLPIHLIFISMTNDGLSANYPRTIVRLEENSAATVIESYVSLDEGVAFTNALTQVELAENARLQHYKLHNENTSTFHFSHTQFRQQKDSQLVSLNLNFGGKLVRNNLHALLAAPGAEAVLDGLYLGHQTQHIDNHTKIEHISPNCESHELYQGILTDQARAVFSGLIYVHRDAQKTDAKQSNNCLLLSEDAKVDSKPQLEIYADDVKCTHGATVGQLDKAAIFYLRSRGFGEQRARNILTYAFAEKVIDKIKIEPLRERVDNLILQRFKEDMNFVK